MLVTSCSGGDDNKTLVPRCIATGSAATSSFQFGNALARVLTDAIPGSQWKVNPRAASRSGLSLVASESCDVAIVAGDSATTAVEGDSENPPMGLRALGRLYDSTVQLVVPRESNIDSVADLSQSRRVSIGPRLSCTRLVAVNMLRAAGVPNDRVRTSDLDLPEAIKSLRSGEIEAFFWSDQVPSQAIEALGGQGTRIRLVNTDDLLPKLRAQEWRSYGAATVPEKTYGQDADAHTVSVPNYLMVSASMENRLAYDITKQLFERRDQLTAAAPVARGIDVRTAISTQPAVALHRGALQYYRDVKP